MNLYLLIYPYEQRLMRIALAVLGIWLLLGLLPFNAKAYIWTGRVVAIHDGDTLTALRYGRAVKLRLNAVDAPELGQPFGRQSRSALSNLCFGRYAMVESVGQDKYDRTLARVKCGGLDVNAEQLRRGMAWHYAQYDQDPALRQLEAEARRQRAGLWSAGRPEPPWDYRHGDAREKAAPRRSLAAEAVPRGCGKKRHCNQMASCAEARYYLNRCGVRSLDGNRDGTPCESLCKAAAE